MFVMYYKNEPLSTDSVILDHAVALLGVAEVWTKKEALEQTFS
jgi:hypothetical protein